MATPIVAMLCLALVSAQAAWRARRRPWDLAFVVLAYTALALLFLCLRAYDRLARESPPGDDGGERRRRRRLKLAVWALSTALSVAFAWRVVAAAAPMPPALKAAVWGMTCAVALAGLYLMYLCDGTGGYCSKTGDITCMEATKLEPEQTV